MKIILFFAAFLPLLAAAAPLGVNQEASILLARNPGPEAAGVYRPGLRYDSMLASIQQSIIQSLARTMTMTSASDRPDGAVLLEPTASDGASHTCTVATCTLPP